MERTVEMAAAATTERKLHVAGAPRPPARRPGADRITVILLALTGFLLVLALLAWQLASSQAKTATRPALVVRRVYQTTVITTVRGGGSGTSMSQSVSSSGSAGPSLAAPVTSSSR